MRNVVYTHRFIDAVGDHVSYSALQRRTHRIADTTLEVIDDLDADRTTITFVHTVNEV